MFARREGLHCTLRSDEALSATPLISTCSFVQTLCFRRGQLRSTSKKR